MMRTPFWGALLLSLLAYARQRYPDYQATIDTLVAALLGAWGGSVHERVCGSDGSH